MLILGLDLSSHSGWALLQDNNLIACGVINVHSKNQNFPVGIYEWAINCSNEIFDLSKKYKFVDKIVIEQTNLGKNREKQSFLEWFHFHFLHIIDVKNNKKINYVDTSKWRKNLQLKLTKEQKQQNKFVKKQHQIGNRNVLQNGKRIGKITAKHLAVQYVNDHFDLKLKHKYNDIADAICIGLSGLN